MDKANLQKLRRAKGEHGSKKIFQSKEGYLADYGSNLYKRITQLIRMGFPITNPPSNLKKSEELSKYKERNKKGRGENKKDGRAIQDK